MKVSQVLNPLRDLLLNRFKKSLILALGGDLGNWGEGK